jgi:hypothetical protein
MIAIRMMQPCFRVGKFARPLVAAFMLSACARLGHISQTNPTVDRLSQTTVIPGGTPAIVMFSEQMLSRAPMLTDRPAGISDEKFVLAANVALHSLDSDLRQGLSEVVGKDISDTTQALELFEEIVSLGGRLSTASTGATGATGATGTTPRDAAIAQISCGRGIQVEYQLLLDHLKMIGVVQNAFCGQRVTLRPPGLYWFRSRSVNGSVTELKLNCRSGCPVNF